MTHRSEPDKSEKSAKKIKPFPVVKCRGGYSGAHGPQREACLTRRHGAHCVTKVVLFGTRRGSVNETWGSATESLCRSRSKDAGTAELRAESDDVDERIGEARFRTRGRGGSGDGAWFSPCDCRGGWDRGDG